MMVHHTEKLRYAVAALCALFLILLHPELATADEALYRLTKEVETRVDEMAAGIAETQVDVYAIPGRASFIAWALDKVDALEQAGYIISDAVFLADVAASSTSGTDRCRAAALLFKTLGRLRAEEAAPVLSRFMLVRYVPLVSVRSLPWWEGFPACVALACIGQPALPLVMSKARSTNDAQLIKNCAWVAGTILGEEGPEWLDRQIALEKDVVAKPRLEAMTKEIELCAWQARWEREKADKKAAREAEIEEQQLANEVFE